VTKARDILVAFRDPCGLCTSDDECTTAWLINIRFGLFC
jgi:hypothetical protein